MENLEPKHELKKLWLKRTLIFFGVLVVGIIVVNLNYWPSLISYLINGQTQIYTTPNYDQVHKNDFGQPNFLTIEALHIQAPVLFASTTKEAEFQTLLKNGVVHYPGTALAGQPGNVYIFGHSSDFIFNQGSYKHVFSTLPDIQIGTIIKLSGADGKIYNYKVFKTQVVAADDISVLNQGDLTKHILTVQTSYPVGTALERFVAIAQLQE